MDGAAKHRARSTSSELAQRIKEFSDLLAAGFNRAQATDIMAEKYSVTTRQARRYGKSAIGAKNGPPKIVESISYSGFFYMVKQHKTNLIKAGASARWHEMRKSSLRVGKETSVLRLVESRSYRSQERLIRDYLAEYRIPCSEWFFCDTETAIAAFDLSMKVLELEPDSICQQSS